MKPNGLRLTRIVLHRIASSLRGLANHIDPDCEKAEVTTDAPHVGLSRWLGGSQQRKAFFYKSKTYDSIIEADSEEDALRRVHDVFRRNRREHYINQPHSFKETMMSEQDCIDAAGLFIPKQPT